MGESDQFCIFILSHRRSDRVDTLRTLKRFGSEIDTFIVIDDQDPEMEDYLSRYGDQVVIFCKDEAAAITDRYDNDPSMGTPLFARNACFDLAEKMGYRYFLVLDDDYVGFEFKVAPNGDYQYQLVNKIDPIFFALLDYFKKTPSIESLAMSQTGDHIGGSLKSWQPRRKVMNSFFCDTKRRFDFVARFNDDVTTYVTHGSRGKVFLSIMEVVLKQKPTQSNPGGLTEAYLEHGTYVKSFYTVIGSPSSAKVFALQDGQSNKARLHHKIISRNTYPMILRDTV